MSILTATTQDIKGGFAKQIDSGAAALMFEILQRHQYQFPIRSLVREIVCNGLDSNKEKEVALKIISGAALIEDYYVSDENESDLYKDSKFDSTYYNPEFLSTDPKVYIDYYEGTEMKKDRIEFKDNGVGLWGKRLVGYWNLGYSTKRRSKHTIGKFGLGNKSPLAVNDVFTTTTVYNGKKATFNVYSSRVESITPKFNLETGAVNEEETVILADGTPYTFYVEPTTEKNSLTVIVEAKKHHREQYIEAVKNQLLYFNNVELRVHNEYGQVTEVPVFSKVLFENDQIIMSENRHYSKPHVIMSGVNYGYIDFKELELEDLDGNIGIKVKAEEIEVSPSRESLIWNDITKATILKRFNECRDVATILIQEELKETDFIRWLRVCANISSRNWNTGSPISRLASIVDVKTLSPKFKGIPFHHSVFKNLKVRKITLETGRKKNIDTIKIYRDSITFLGDSIHLPILVSTNKASNRKDKFLSSTVYKDGFILIQKSTDEDIVASVQGKEFPNVNSSKEIDFAKKVQEFLLSSTEVISYDDIEVPDSFKGSEDEEEILESEETINTVFISTEERRKLEGKTIVFTPRSKFTWDIDRIYEWQKIEVPIKEINNWDEEEIYYGNDADAEMLEFIALLTRTSDNTRYPRTGQNYKDDLSWDETSRTSKNERLRCSHYFQNPKIKLIKVSKANQKLYKDFNSASQFFLKFKNKNLTMSNILIKWNTARKLLPKLNKLAFLYNFPDAEKRDFYRFIVQYTAENYKPVLKYSSALNNVSEAHEALLTHLEKVENFQIFLASNPTPEEIKEVAKDMWQNPDIEDAKAIDLNLIRKVEELEDWARPVAELLNRINVLTGSDYDYLQQENHSLEREETSISEELEKEIKWYCTHKNVI